MARGDLRYSTEASEILALFHRKHFALLQGGRDKGEEQANSATAKGDAPISPKADMLSKKKRVPGLHRSAIKFSDDFNDPLPDEFWLGTE